MKETELVLAPDVRSSFCYVLLPTLLV